MKEFFEGMSTLEQTYWGIALLGSAVFLIIFVLTFIGGGDAAAVACTSNSVSNGYQKSQNINVSNNTIINTNAPLFLMSR